MSSAVENQAEKPAATDGEATTIEAADVLREDDIEQQWDVSANTGTFDDPLLISLSALAGLLDRPTSVETLRAGLPIDAEGISPELCVRAAERAGLNARISRRGKLNKIAPLTMPCILLMKDRGACILLEFPNKKEAKIFAPESGGTIVVDLKDLQEQYAGYAFFAKATAQFDERTADLQLINTKRWFWGTLFRFLPIYRHVLLASFLINMLAIATPLFTMNVYDRVVPNNAIETLQVLAIGILIVFAFDFVLKNLRSYFVDVAGKNADIIIASKLLQQVMGMRFDQRPASSGSLANNLREFESLRDFFSSSTLIAVVDLPFIAIFIAVIYFIGGPIAAVPMIMAPIVVIVGIVLQYPLGRVVEKTYRESSQKHSLLIEAINGLEAIKAAGAEGQIQRQWEKLVGLTAKSSGKARMISTVSTSFAQTATQLTTVGVIVFGVFEIAEGNMTIGALIACTILVGRAMAPLGAVAAMLTKYQQSRIALRGLDELMKTPVERPATKAFIHRPKIEGSIEVRNVTFSYPNAQSNALEQISLKVKVGERVGIIGRIGSGKSTIGRMLIGLYEPSDGAMMIGGSDIRQLDPAELRRNVGYVSQDNYLFFGSVRDNIIFGAQHVDDPTILRAAEVSGVTDFLGRTPLGFDLPVGERGMGLSGGQRQAICVARALLLDPPILVLDEPTSSMDNSSETTFRKRLNETMGDKTLILITHRGSMLTLVDRLIIVDAGRIVADGPKEDVLDALRKGQVRGAN